MKNLLQRLTLALCATLPSGPAAWAALPAWADLPPLTAPARALLDTAGQFPARPGYDGVALLEDQWAVIGEDGRTTFRFHSVYRVDREAALDRLGSAVAHWSDWFEERPVLRARVITPDGVEHLLDPATLAVFQAPARQPDLLTDRKELRAPLPAMTRGALVELDLTMAEARPFSRAGARGSLTFAPSIPLQHLRVRLDAPEAARPKWLAVGLGAQDPERIVEAGRVRFRVEAGPLTPLPVREPFAADDQEEPPYLVFGTTPSWNAVAREYLGLVEAQVRDADLGGVARAAAAGARTRAEVVDRLLAHLRRNVRYTGLEFGDAAIVPRTPAEVLRRGYGDCKDQACLLVALLRARGIEAQVALLRAGSMPPFREEVPGLGVFNHAIVYLPGREPAWIDPTARHARAGTLPSADQGRQALVVAASTEGLVRTPALPAAQNTAGRLFEVFLADSGPGRMTVTFTAGGVQEPSLRDAFAGADPAHLPEDLRADLLRGAQAKSLGRIQCGGADDLDRPFRPMVEVLDTGQAYTGNREAWVALNPWPLLSTLDGAVQDPRDGSGKASTGPAAGPAAGVRRTDFQFPETIRSEMRWLIHPPDGFTPLRLPAARTVSFGPARLACRYDPAPGGRVEVVYRFDNTQARWTPADVQAARVALARYKVEPVPMVRFQPEGMADLDAGRVREGLDRLRRTAAGHPGQAAPLVRLARAQLAAGLGESARATARGAVERQPADPRAQETLAWVLAHDVLGRHGSLGWDRQGAAAANRKALVLDPGSRTARWQLALVLERDDLGGRLAGGPDLEEAIQLYRGLLDEEKNESLSFNLTAALAYGGRLAEAERSAEALRGTERGDIWLAAVTACGQGLAAALARAERDIPGQDARWRALLTAGELCAQFRHYPEAAGLLEAGSPGARQPAQIRLRAERLARTRPYRPDPAAARDPKAALQAFLAEVLAPGFGPGRVRELLAPAVRAQARDEDLLQLRRDRLGKPLASGLATAGILDYLASVPEYRAEGGAGRGYRVRLEDREDRESWFLTAEDATFRILWSPTRDLAGLGCQATRLLSLGDARGAAGWLDQALEALPEPDARDPLAGAPLKVLRIPGGPADPGELRLQAACLEAFGRPDRATLDALRAGYRDAGPGFFRGAIGVALANALHRDGDWTGLASVTADLATRFPDSPAVRDWRIRALSLQRDWRGLLAFADQALAGRPGDPALLAARFKALAGLDRLEEAGRVADELAAAGRTGPGTWNALAWSQVEAGRVTARTLDYARNATRDAAEPSADGLLTLAAVLAELGQAAEAREALLRSLDQGAREQPGSREWYVLGRIAEHLDEPAAARAYYGLAASAQPSGRTDVVACSLLAQARLRALGAGGPVRPATAQATARTN